MGFGQFADIRGGGVFEGEVDTQMYNTLDVAENNLNLIKVEETRAKNCSPDINFGMSFNLL